MHIAEVAGRRYNWNMPTKAEPKDVFLHFLAMATLYASAASFIALVFQFINYFIPDVLEMNYYDGYRDGVLGVMRGSLAALVIMFPAYLIVMRVLNASYRADPEKRGLRIRKWLVYFTLFVAAIIILGNLVSLLYNFLEGELTARFSLKMLAVFFVAGSTFYYYLADIRGRGESVAAGAPHA